jgi:hypothetical protein
MRTEEEALNFLGDPSDLVGETENVRGWVVAGDAGGEYTCILVRTGLNSAFAGIPILAARSLTGDFFGETGNGSLLPGDAFGDVGGEAEGIFADVGADVEAGFVADVFLISGLDCFF